MTGFHTLQQANSEFGLRAFVQVTTLYLLPSIRIPPVEEFIEQKSP